MTQAGGAKTAQGVRLSPWKCGARLLEVGKQGLMLGRKATGLRCTITTGPETEKDPAVKNAVGIFLWGAIAHCRIFIIPSLHPPNATKSLSL
jgi:hypothetical protein